MLVLYSVIEQGYDTIDWFNSATMLVLYSMFQQG
jgi:hypothetical protein